jgi:hypothetical protein
MKVTRGQDTGVRGSQVLSSYAQSSYILKTPRLKVSMIKVPMDEISHSCKVPHGSKFLRLKVPALQFLRFKFPVGSLN